MKTRVKFSGERMRHVFLKKLKWTIETVLNHSHNRGVSVTGRYRDYREPIFQRKMDVTASGNQLFHNNSMPLLGCNEERRHPVLVLRINVAESFN